MKIGELAKRSGLSAHTIRYYERIGLLPYADGNQSGQRDYDASILIWINFSTVSKRPGCLFGKCCTMQRCGSAASARKLSDANCSNSIASVSAPAWLNCKPAFSVLDSKIAGYAGIEQRMKDYDAPIPRTSAKAGWNAASGRSLKSMARPVTT